MKISGKKTEHFQVDVTPANALDALEHAMLKHVGAGNAIQEHNGRLHFGDRVGSRFHSKRALSEAENEAYRSILTLLHYFVTNKIS